MTGLVGSVINPTYSFFCVNSEKPNIPLPSAPNTQEGRSCRKVPMDGFIPCASNSVQALGCGAEPNLLGWPSEGCSPPVARQTAFVMSVGKHQDNDPEKSLGCR